MTTLFPTRDEILKEQALNKAKIKDVVLSVPVDLIKAAASVLRKRGELKRKHKSQYEAWKRCKDEENWLLEDKRKWNLKELKKHALSKGLDPQLERDFINAFNDEINKTFPHLTDGNVGGE